jgi:hypothetical protein
MLYARLCGRSASACHVDAGVQVAKRIHVSDSLPCRKVCVVFSNAAEKCERAPRLRKSTTELQRNLACSLSGQSCRIPSRLVIFASLDSSHGAKPAMSIAETHVALPSIEAGALKLFIRQTVSFPASMKKTETPSGPRPRSPVQQSELGPFEEVPVGFCVALTISLTSCGLRHLKSKQSRYEVLRRSHLANHQDDERNLDLRTPTKRPSPPAICCAS